MVHLHRELQHHRVQQLDHHLTRGGVGVLQVVEQKAQVLAETLLTQGVVLYFVVLRFVLDNE